MAADDPDSAPPPIDFPVSIQGDVPPDREAERQSPRHNSRRTLGVMLIAGLLAGVASGLLIDRTHGILVDRSQFLRKLQAKGFGVTPEELAQFIATKQALVRLDVALTVGLAGLVVCAFIGVGRGIIANSPRTAGLAIAGGVLLGAALGAAGGFASAILDRRFAEQQLDPMYLAIIKHGAAWGAVAVAAGLTGVLPTRRLGAIVRAVLPAIAAGIAASMLFVPISALLFPGEFAEFAVPTGLGSRVLWTCLPAILVALAVGRTLSAEREAGNPRN